MYVKFNDPNIGPIAAAAFPKNRKDIIVDTFRGPKRVNSYWDGGSKDEYALVDLVTKQSLGLPTSHPYFDRKSNGERVGQIELRKLPENTALVCGGTFRGKPATVHVLLRQDNLAKLLPPQVELTPEQRSALDIVGSYRGGYRQDEFSRSKLGQYSADNPYIVALADRGLVKVNKVGAISITTDGRNVRAS